MLRAAVHVPPERLWHDVAQAEQRPSRPMTGTKPSGSPSRLDDLVGAVVDSKYRVERLLGRGGMGAVFRAVHVGTDRTVALKVIAPDQADRADFLARFEREARACGRLRHPNIVDVTDFGYADDGVRRLAYLVMEYLDGCSLADVLRDEKALPIVWVVDVLRQVGSALEEAHRAGILHRDLKPDNIWLEPNRRGGYTVKVLDFGLAKLGGPETRAAEAPPATVGVAEQPAPALDAPPAPASLTEGDETEGATRVRSPARGAPAGPAEDGATAVGSIVGTPAYMSPEQCRGLPLTPSSDVYSLAVLAYRLLSGELPFSGSPEALVAAHVAESPRALGKLRRDLPKDAAALVMRALSKAPDERPPSAGAFAEMLAARAQTSGEFVKEAVLLFLEHARAFLSASILYLSPVLLLGLFGAVNALAAIYGSAIVSRGAGPAFVVACILVTVGPGMLLVQGTVVPAVMQAVVSPLQPIDVRTLHRRFRPRLRAYVRAIVPILVLFVVMGLWQIPVRWWTAALRPIIRDENAAVALSGALLTALLPNVPFVAMLLLLARAGAARAFQFLGAVAVVEGLPAKDAIARSVRLAKACSQRPVRVMIIGIALGAGISGGLGFGALARRLPPEVALGALSPLFALAFVLVGPFMSVVNALMYLRARRALGEPLDKALEEFERAVLPESHWKLAERERVATLIASRR
jgi:serine/threonine protein kinase